MAREKLSKLGAKLSDLEEAATARLEDARALEGSRYATAIAMGLYALEISLKVAICRRLDVDALPVTFQIHDFQGLLIFSGLSRRIEDPENVGIKRNWDFIVGKYNNHHTDSLRYSPGTQYLPKDARKVLDCLEDPSDGILTWLSAQA